MDLSQDVSFVPPAPCQIPHIPRQETREYPPEDWERKRPEIEQLYIKEDLKLEQVMEKMAESGFLATYVLYISLRYHGGKSNVNAGH